MTAKVCAAQPEKLHSAPVIVFITHWRWFELNEPEGTLMIRASKAGYTHASQPKVVIPESLVESVTVG
jgi:hypothetical protein